MSDKPDDDDEDKAQFTFWEVTVGIKDKSGEIEFPHYLVLAKDAANACVMTEVYTDGVVVKLEKSSVVDFITPGEDETIFGISKTTTWNGKIINSR